MLLQRRKVSVVQRKPWWQSYGFSMTFIGFYRFFNPKTKKSGAKWRKVGEKL